VNVRADGYVETAVHCEATLIDRRCCAVIAKGSTQVTELTNIGLRRWVKTSDHPIAKAMLSLYFGLRRFHLPVIPGVHIGLYVIRRLVISGISNVLRIVWYTPLFQSRLESPAPGLYLYGGMPLVLGPIRITMGANCRVAAAINIIGRANGAWRPELIVGDNVDVGWNTRISVGRRVVIGSNTRIAGSALFTGFPGHPLDHIARAKGESDTDDQVGDIVLEDDVWLASGVTISGGVRIGRGTVVAAGSVVTKDLPSFVLAGGVPAQVIRPLKSGA
jgi:acetyltransferase-like isoleucine patch superfamily enzyme